MRIRRLLNTRWVRRHPKARARIYRNHFGRLASFRKAWRKLKHDNGGKFAVLIALIKSLTAARANPFKPLRSTPDHYIEPLKANRPRKRVRWHRALSWQMAQNRKERYGLDVTGHGAADVRRVMRNARKAERC